MYSGLSSLIRDFDKKSIQVQKILDKGEGISAEDVTAAKKLNIELEEIKKSIVDLRGVSQSVANHQEFLNAPIGGLADLIGIKQSGHTTMDSRGVLDQNGEGLLDEKTLRCIGSSEYKSAFRTYLRKGEWGLSSHEAKTLQSGLDPEGGFLVPQDMLSKMIEKSPTPTRVSSHVTHLHTSRDTLLIPRVDYSKDDIYSNGMRVTWTSENFEDASKHQVTDPKFGQLSIPIHTAMMSLRISHDMVEDSLFPIQAWCADKFRETAELLLDEMVLHGTGIGQPSGILRNPGQPNQPGIVNLWSNGVLDPDKIQKMAFSLPEQYVSNAKWVFNLTDSAHAISQLKDGSHRNLWGNGLNDTHSGNGYLNRRLMNFPVIFSGFMPNNIANKPSIIFGDLSGYYLVHRVGFSIQVLREVEALRNRLVLVGRMRFGGAVAEPWKMKIGISSN